LTTAEEVQAVLRDAFRKINELRTFDDSDTVLLAKAQQDLAYAIRGLIIYADRHDV
jgi:hypothetical protein